MLPTALGGPGSPISPFNSVFDINSTTQTHPPGSSWEGKASSQHWIEKHRHQYHRLHPEDGSREVRGSNGDRGNVWLKTEVMWWSLKGNQVF